MPVEVLFPARPHWVPGRRLVARIGVPQADAVPVELVAAPPERRLAAGEAAVVRDGAVLVAPAEGAAAAELAAARPVVGVLDAVGRVDVVQVPARVRVPEERDCALVLDPRHFLVLVKPAREGEAASVRPALGDRVFVVVGGEDEDGEVLRGFGDPRVFGAFSQLDDVACFGFFTCADCQMRLL